MSFIQGWSKKSALAAAVLALLSMFLLVRLFTGSQEPGLSPEKAIEKAISNTKQARSYRYETEVKTVIKDEESYVSKMSGVRGGSDRVHIKGKVVDSDIEFYQIGSTTYMKDQLSSKWLIFRGNELNQSEILMNELNPLASLRYKELRKVSYQGKGEADGADCWIYEAEPVIDNPYLEFLWRDFTFRLWVEQDGMRIARAVVEAASKNTEEGKYVFEARFYDYDKKISVTPPTP